MEHRADGVALLRAVRQDLDADGAAQAMDAPDERDHETVRNLGRMASRSSASGLGGLFAGHR
jgi:hypothetical protein